MQSGTKGLVVILVLAVALLGLAAMDQWHQHEAAIEGASKEARTADDPAPAVTEQGKASTSSGAKAEDLEQKRFDELNPNLYQPM